MTWAHLPNARHIDAVLAHVKQHPDKWDVAYDSAYDSARVAAQDAAQDAARGAARGAAWVDALAATWDAARDAAWDAALHAARVTARDACYALIAWDDAGDLLAMPVDAVRLLAECGHHPAALLLPAVTALNSSKD